MSKAKEKQQPYFPHYANSRNEDPMIRLRMEHGVAGYGVYHMLLERLRMSENYQADLDYDILCWDLDCSQELIRSVIYDFGLFEIVCDGQKFQSIEMCAYMQLMEEKKRERSEKAKAAAEARWGNNTMAQQPNTTPIAQQPVMPELIEETPQEDSTERLDKEIEMIKMDDTWLDTMAQESGKAKEELISFLSDFKNACVLKGLKGGHKNMEDTLCHFRSWIYKSGRAKDPNAPQNKQISGNARGKNKNADDPEKRAKERQDDTSKYLAELDENFKRSAGPWYIVRRMGYDPEELGKDVCKVMDPNWRAKNPPTHPEWITTPVESEMQSAEVPY